MINEEVELTVEDLVNILGSVVDRAVADLRLDLLGWDSCVLAVRLIHERLKMIDIRSQPLAAVLQANYGRHEGWLIGEGGAPGHAILLVRDSLVIDPTINQLHERNDVFPAIDTFALLLPEDKRVATRFGATFRSKEGVFLRYDVDRTVPAYFLDSLDWTRPIEDVERYVQHAKTLDKETFISCVEYFRKKTESDNSA